MANEKEIQKDQPQEAVPAQAPEVAVPQKPEELEKVREKAKKGPRGKKARQVGQGRVYISSSFNNTLISVTDSTGNLLVQGSAGASGFKGSKKSTPFAASVSAENALKKARTMYGLTEVDVFVKGVGSGRESAVRALGNAGILVNSIRDVTPLAHNGCRAKKPRRV